MRVRHSRRSGLIPMWSDLMLLSDAVTTQGVRRRTVGSVPLDAVGARRFYDRLGRFQDTQRFYEDPAVHRLVDLAAFEQSGSVFELGCGTGRLAANLLDSVLSSSTSYVGVDVSPTMVDLASQRLSRWPGRAMVQLLDPPALTLPGDDESSDRFLATYVFDLLPPDDVSALVDQAARLLAPGGLLALCSLANGTTTASRVVSSAWNAVALRWPSLVGGCRPTNLKTLVSGPDWQIRHWEVVVHFAVPSGLLVAERTESRAG
jgi:ubiquinone/menaquinone biosynthesis C-methylase UbiE